MRAVWIVVAVCLLGSCRTTAAPELGDPDRVPPDTLTVRVGETVVLEGADITLNRIASDSRCPIDVLCPWEGNAAAEIAVGPGGNRKGPTYQLVLNTSLEPRVGQAWGLRIELLEVRPQPVSTEPIPPETYSVVLFVGPAR